jgi:pimeloyl-ACP methyl ester carboxylesterase
MQIIDVGSGPPVVVIPGIQGRWEWMKPGIDALARRCRVVTFSLADEPRCGGHFDAAEGFACYVEQVRAAMDAAAIERAAICGVSYGGLIAAAFAARHPARTASLILVSALPPTWAPDPRVRFYLRAPRLLAPLFVLASVRMYREIAAANSGVTTALRAATHHGWTAATHMFSPGRMARRVGLIERLNLQGELAQVAAPVLVVTGDRSLDRVVPVPLTEQYLTIWPHAQVARLERTGHLGMLTRPDEFTRIVAPFVADTTRASGPRRRVG